MTCNELFGRMEEKYAELGISDVNGVFQFNIDGQDGGRWHAVCAGPSCQVLSGPHESPDVTVSARSEHVIKLAEGRMNPALALLTGKVKIKGKPSLLAKVQSLLSGLR